MELTLILGPMKSGKSFEMISNFMPLAYTDINYGIYQPQKNIREENLWSRNGVSIQAKKIETLFEILNKQEAIVGIDEIHMFAEKDAEAINSLISRGTKIFISGLDMDYQGKIFPIIKKIFELGPQKVNYKRAVCEICKKPNAIYTQVYQFGIPVVDGVPSVLPEDGTYEYKPVCRQCFQKNN
ncbi:MAG: thymidine kinase [Candidatus Paceibacterota bacterium]